MALLLVACWSRLVGGVSLYGDAPELWTYSFMDGASVIMEGIEELHGAVLYYIVGIIVAVGYMMVAAMTRFRKGDARMKYSNHG